MKKPLFILLLVAAIGQVGFAQGNYSFGSQTNPDLVLETNHPGYDQFVTAVKDYSNSEAMTVDWESVSDAISSVPSLEPYVEWLNSHIGGYVYVHCCTLQSGQDCSVAVPMSCSACGCDSGEDHAPW